LPSISSILTPAPGIISVIKAAMILEKGMILPNINFETPNEKIPFDDWNMKVILSYLVWKVIVYDTRPQRHNVPGQEGRNSQV
jgi:acyl transferase domain-containing protein